jgi:hypothetical protein
VKASGDAASADIKAAVEDPEILRKKYKKQIHMMENL